MKSLIATVLLLILMLTVTVLNFLFINQTADEITAEIDALPPVGTTDCISAAEELLRFWEARSTTVTLSVGYATADRVTEQAKLLISSARSGDVYGYTMALTLLADAVEDMRRLEQFSVKNLF